MMQYGVEEYKVEIGGTTYGMEDIQSVIIEQPLFDELSVGNACCAELRINFWQISTIPRMAKIVPYARRVVTDPWTKLGEFYIDTRSTTDGLMEIVAYDSMLKSEIVWVPTQSLEFPMTMREAVYEIADLMGVGVDSRNVFNASYYVDYPANDYTLRDVLRFIAGAHGGNWIITADNNLLLIPLFSTLPTETFYIVTEEGDAITFGGDRILHGS